MKVETKRLLLYPISNADMELLIENEQDPDMRQAYSEMLQGCLNAPETRVWNAVWYMELKETPGAVVGDFSFKGLGSDGSVEIGYGLKEAYTGHGYMTEAVKAISEWALTQPGVSCVTAEAEEHNDKSKRVLRRAGFCPIGEWGAEGPRYLYRSGSVMIDREMGITEALKTAEINEEQWAEDRNNTRPEPDLNSI